MESGNLGLALLDLLVLAGVPVHIAAARLGEHPKTVLYAQENEMNNPPSQTLLDRIQRWAAGREVLLVVIRA